MDEWQNLETKWSLSSPTSYPWGTHAGPIPALTEQTSYGELHCRAHCKPSAVGMTALLGHRFIHNWTLAKVSGEERIEKESSPRGSHWRTIFYKSPNPNSQEMHVKRQWGFMSKQPLWQFTFDSQGSSVLLLKVASTVRDFNGHPR